MWLQLLTQIQPIPVNSVWCVILTNDHNDVSHLPYFHIMVKSCSNSLYQLVAVMQHTFLANRHFRELDEEPQQMCKSNVSHLQAKIAAKDLEKHYLGILHKSSRKLFCIVCNIEVEHKRKSLTDMHFATAKHKMRMTHQRGRSQWHELRSFGLHFTFWTDFFVYFDFADT